MGNKVISNVRIIQKCFVINSEDRVLALKRPIDDKSRGGCWDTPGGGYEEGENIVDAIKREVKEEAGLSTSTVKPFFLDSKVGSKLDLWGGDNVFVIAYVCTDWEGELKLSEEHIEYRWVTPDEFALLDFGKDGGFFTEAVKHLQI